MKFLLILLNFYIFECRSQFPEYYVYLVKGKTYLEGTSKNRKILMQGDYLFNNDVISLKANAEITLVNRLSNYLVISKPGLIRLNTISKNFLKSYSGTSQKYIRLVWEEVLDPSKSFFMLRNKNLYGVSGGVERGDDCNNLIFPVNGLKTSMDSVTFRWRRTGITPAYNLLIYDNQGSEIFHKEVTDTQQVINMHQLLNGRLGNYYWKVKSQDTDCEQEVPLKFTRMPVSEEKKYIALLVSKEKDTTLESRFSIIDSLEENGFILSAIDYYSRLIKSYAGNENLVKSYILFLLKYRFETNAQVEWKRLKGGR